ncbi:hypothetical protein OG393_30855 [Streptomyces sp. NBC_01216]|uniref:hypothetical protein n=1 Tax=Streptomyces sp. NBC_01216 TaxID=2903778 RepID=UPI002E0D3A14|nr:hypothetical protein OG393_30855 [Streptomyces sp. NBC_01216]
MNPTVPRRFYLHRTTDNTGVSGTGRVADGILWTDGTVSIRWLGERPSTVFWNSIHNALHVHGHGGATRVVWLDFEETEIENDLPCLHCIDGHGAPDRCTWGVRVGPQRDGDGQPVHLIVGPTDGQHVAPEDAAWLRTVIHHAQTGDAR